MRYKIIIQYDGTDFHGWQKQPGARTVQQTLGEALAPLSPDGAPVAVHGCGRTDAGVHAEGQVAHFDLEREMTPVQLRRAFNGMLKRGDVQILEAEHAAPDFDARRHALGKEYRYRVWNAEVMNPFWRRFAAHVRTPLDAGAMRAAAAHFVGEHDFAAFSANPSREIESTVRTIWSLGIVDRPALRAPLIRGEFTGLTEFRVRGNGFLYKMVRSISGFLIAVGLGREKPDAALEILASRTRTARVESAAPQGRTFWEAWY